MYVLRTEPMQKVRIISVERDKSIVIAALHAMGAIDLRKTHIDSLQDDKPADYTNDLSDALIKVSGALQLLTSHPVRMAHHIRREKLIDEVKKHEELDTIYALDAERKSISDETRSLNYAVEIATYFREISIDFSRISSSHIGYKAFEADKKSAYEIKKRIESAKVHSEVHMVKAGKKRYALLIAYEKNKPIEDIYRGVPVTELDLASKYLSGTPEEVIRSAAVKTKENSRRIGDISKEMLEISRRHYSDLANLKEMLEIELERAEASSNFKRTESTFVIEGWVQKRQVGELRSRMASVTNGRASIEIIDSEGELAPTHTRRPKFLQPFDYMVNFYSVPRSDEIDPTWIFIISFPIFYGLMVTDVGYGLASLIMATLITKRTDPDGLMYNAAKIWQLNSVAAMIFGFLSNEWFGFQLNQYIAPFQGFSWFKDTPALIAITVIFGVVQVILGLGIGAINARSHGHKKIAIAKVTSMLVVGFGTVAVAGAFFGAFNTLVTEISGAIAIVSLLLTGILSGTEATEITNLITHPMSYARLMGFGLGSVIIAYLIDMAFTPHLSSGIVIFVLYMIIFVVLQFLNMTLAIFEGIVQGVRLNFVEFFSKFYIGNGIRFRPFGYRRIYTKDNSKNW
jgi:V/A-type H+-transporting ATPase subunit I